MLILGLLGMYFDAAVVFATSQTLLFRLALAILCIKRDIIKILSEFISEKNRWKILNGIPIGKAIDFLKITVFGVLPVHKLKSI